jgi:hypothetical protein
MSGREAKGVQEDCCRRHKRQKTIGVMAPLAVSAFIFHSASRTTEQVSFGRPSAVGSSFSWNTFAKACFLGVHPGDYETAARMLETDADGVTAYTVSSPATHDYKVWVKTEQ